MIEELHVCSLAGVHSSIIAQAIELERLKSNDAYCRWAMWAENAFQFLYFIEVHYEAILSLFLHFLQIGCNEMQ